MWDPEDDGNQIHQRPPFRKTLTPPNVEPGSGALRSAWWNPAWTPAILGALETLLEPSTWNTSDPATLATVLAQAQELLQNIAIATLASYVE